MGGFSVPECNNSSEKGINVLQCPSKAERRSLWINYLRDNGYKKRAENIPKFFNICEIHFASFYDKNVPKPKKENPSVPKSTWIKVKLKV